MEVLNLFHASRPVSLTEERILMSFYRKTEQITIWTEIDYVFGLCPWPRNIRIQIKRTFSLREAVGGFNVMQEKRETVTQVRFPIFQSIKSLSTETVTKISTTISIPVLLRRVAEHVMKPRLRN